ncbi:MAG: polysaccharide biosynthesis/export family protein [Pseudomonadota bacterium]
MSFFRPVVRLLISLSVLVALGACGLPRTGPYYEELTEAEQDSDYGFHVLPLTPDIARITRVDEATGFSVGFISRPAEAVYTLATGDVLSITVWENIDEGLLNPAGIGATPLPSVRVDETGRVFVPYIGPIRAAGLTESQLRQRIQAALAEKTLNPQVNLYRVEANGRQISIQGVINAPGLYPIEPPTTHILPMMARAGGVSIDPEVVRLKLRRGQIQGEIWLQDLYDEPRNDVHLLSGDAIIAERDRRIFTALGAVNRSATVQFPTRDVSVIRALGTVGGLSDQTADPTGVFLFREEPEEIAKRLLPGQEITGPQRMAYIVDFTQPAGLFLARDFMMRDGDTIYVTTAPFVRWLKILQAISPLVNFAGSTRSLGGF